MDNTDNKLNEDNQVSVNIETPDESIKSNTEQPEKSRNGRGIAVFSLLLALLAVFCSGWLYYHTQLPNENPNNPELLIDMASQKDLQQLQTRITNIEQTLAQQKQVLEQKSQHIDRLQQALNNLPDKQYDASDLERQISTLQQDFKQLKSQYREPNIETNTAEQLSVLARAQAINALKTVELLIAQQQLTEAVNVLKQWRNNDHLPLAIQTRLQQLVTTLSNVETPDIESLRQQLRSANNNIAALSLTTESQIQEQPAWYERFVTVKKIKPEQQDLNSIDLLQIKANAAQSLQQAELGLILKQSTVWKNALQQAQTSLSQTSLDSQEIIRTLQHLSKQEIVIQVPTDLGIDTLIRQLEGISE